jgi:PAS domain-containing protein
LRSRKGSSLRRSVVVEWGYGPGVIGHLESERNAAGAFIEEREMPREDDGAPALRDLEARVASLEATLRDKEQVEAQLRESEARLALVLEGTNDGWWDWRRSTGASNRMEVSSRP